MPTLTGITPTPAQFRQAIEQELGDLVRDAAGADGRLTRNEAKTMAHRPDAGWILSDNAVNYLEITGQKTVSAEKLIRKIGEYAEREAEAHAGSNQKLSLLEARSLPADLQAEFFYLRGKGLPDRVEPADLETAVRELVSAGLDAESFPRLPSPPWQVMGHQPVIDHVPHPASHTRAIVYVVDDHVWINRAAPAGPGQHLVGWYDGGEVPSEVAGLR